MIETECQVDMHIHTTASDGTWTNEELLNLIIERNIKLFSITDHDTIENSVSMLSNIPDNINYIVGVEVSCTYNNQEFHITAYDFDYKNIKLNELLKFNQIQREEFNTKIIQYVKKINSIIDINDYSSYKYDRNRGGWESLNYLLDKNIVKDLNDYFKILKSSNEKLCLKNPKEVIQIIKEAGGYPFLAHPSAYEKGDKLSIEVLREWRDYGICGIECFSPYLKNVKDAEYYVDFCNKNNLMISAGSDCHGEFNDRTLGIPKVNIEDLKLDFVQTMLKTHLYTYLYQ